MNQDQLNKSCESYQNVDGFTLHTDDPGNTGANDSGITKASLTWGDPVTGVMGAAATFTDVPVGEYPWGGLWDGTVFIEAVPLNLTTFQVLSTLTVKVEHHVKERV